MKRLLIPIVPLAFLAIFFFYPLASITARGLAPQGAINLSVFGKIIGREYYRETWWFTFWQAAISAVLRLDAEYGAKKHLARTTSHREIGARRKASIVISSNCFAPPA